MAMLAITRGIPLAPWIPQLPGCRMFQCIAGTRRKIAEGPGMVGPWREVGPMGISWNCLVPCSTPKTSSCPIELDQSLGWVEDPTPLGQLFVLLVFCLYLGVRASSTVATVVASVQVDMSAENPVSNIIQLSPSAKKGRTGSRVRLSTYVSHLYIYMYMHTTVTINC